jgi:hypothetical protein
MAAAVAGFPCACSSDSGQTGAVAATASIDSAGNASMPDVDGEVGCVQRPGVWAVARTPLDTVTAVACTSREATGADEVIEIDRSWALGPDLELPTGSTGSCSLSYDRCRRECALTHGDGSHEEHTERVTSPSSISGRAIASFPTGMRCAWQTSLQWRHEL